MGCGYDSATTASGVEILARVWGTNGEREVQEADIISAVEFDKIGDHLATGDKENFSSGFHVEKRLSSLVLCWQRKELILASAWSSVKSTGSFSSSGEWEYICLYCFQPFFSSQGLAGHQKFHRSECKWKKGVHHLRVPRRNRRDGGSSCRVAHVQPPPRVNVQPPSSGSGLRHVGAPMGATGFRPPVGVDDHVTVPGLGRGTLRVKPVALNKYLSAHANNLRTSWKGVTGANSNRIDRGPVNNDKPHEADLNHQELNGTAWDVPGSQSEDSSERTPTDRNSKALLNKVENGVEVTSKAKEKMDLDLKL
ncbi:hypothetical protein F0562_017218 [Nyssa sinensis]|uniref:C2H2-type domain-containing protein n=1 Tax=Nyssa sinensis TaxID=561372 RepID=A0A5J4ZGJ7_9ASTE|nr:hypothetical protein F0562_017218 [Nyssa sinensis]